jgi:hypothetical protein
MQQNPAETLREIDQLRGRTHKVLNHFSFPCILFGALMVISAAVGLVAGGLATGIFWMVAGPVGGAVTGLYYRRRERALGVETSPRAWIVTSVAILIGCMSAGFGGAALDLPMLSALGPLLCISAGYLVFGRLSNSTSLSVSAVVLAIVVVAMWLTGAGEQVGSVGTALYGVVLFTIGLMNRRTEVWAP